MKHFYILLLATLASAQNISFADPNLKAFLLTSSSENNIAHVGGVQYIALDANADGEIQIAETENVIGLNLDGTFTSFAGLEQFANLSGFSLANSIGSVAFPSIPGLTDLYFENGNIASLDLSQLANLTLLSFNGTIIPPLDLSSTTIHRLDFSAMTMPAVNLPQSLQNMQLFEVIAAEVNIHDMPNLTLFNILQSPGVNSINVSNCAVLDQLLVDDTGVTMATVQNCAALTVCVIQYGLLSDLQITNCPLLSDVNVSTNQLHELSLDLPSLLTLECSDNSIETLTLNTPHLYVFNCSGNLLESLDFSNFEYMPDVNASLNHLKSINIKNGSQDSFFSSNFLGNPDLHYICADEQDIETALEYMQQIGQSCEINTYCTFVPGGDSASISGNVRYDADANGCDAADLPMPLKFNIVSTESEAVVYPSNGSYQFNLPIGSYQLVPQVENPAYFSISPQSVALEITEPNQNIAQDFCVSPNGTHHDAEIFIAPLTNALPGFQAQYYVAYRNNGTTAESGAVTVSYSENVQDFVSSTQTVTNANGSFTFPFTGLQPFETRHFMFTLENNTPTEIPPLQSGDALLLSASVSISQDEVSANSTAELHQLAINSMDPNDKICVEGTTVSTQTVGDYVHYLIRFENTGTAPAHNIVVKDVIDSEKFDISTLVPLSASHSLTTRFTDAATAEFIFEGIDLPFNEPENDGYVIFKIKTKPTLVAGDDFSNSASIYFDYNFPIVTEPAVTHIENLSVSDFEFGDYFRLYPNPASHTISLQSVSGLQARSIEIYDAAARLVLAQTASQTVDISTLSQGLYFVKVTTDKGSSIAKFVKK